MIERIIKLTFTIILSTSVFALPNEFNKAELNTYLSDNLNIFCAPESADEPVRKLLSTLDVFTCSNSAEEKNFCNCVSKMESNLSKEKLAKVTNEIQDSLAQKYANEYFEKDFLTDMTDRLEAIHNIQKFMPNLASGCFTSLNPNGSKTEQLLYKHELKLRGEVEKTLSSAENIVGRADFLEMAEKIFDANSDRRKSMVLERDLGYEKGVYDSIGFLMASNQFDALVPKDEHGQTDFSKSIWCGGEITASERIQKQAFYHYVDNGHNTANKNERLINAIQNAVHFSCESLVKDLDKYRSIDDLEPEFKKEYLKSGKTLVQDHIASLNKNYLIDSLTEMKASHSSKTGETLEDLERDYYYDVAYCKMTGNDFEIRSKEVQEVVVANEAAVMAVNNAIDTSTDIIEQHQDIDEELEKREEFIETIMNSVPEEGKVAYVQELAEIKVLRTKNQEAMNEEIVTRNQHEQRAYSIFGSEENYHLYRSQTKANRSSAPSHVSIENDQIVVKTRQEYNEELESYYAGQRVKVRNSDVFKKHSGKGRLEIEEDIKVEKDKLIDLNNSYLSTDRESRSSSKTDQLINEMRKDISKEDILKEASSIEKNMLPNLAKKKAAKSFTATRVKANTTNVMPPIREDKRFEKVVNSLSQSQKRVDPRIQSALQQLNRQSSLNTELETKLAEYKEKDTKLSNTLKPIQASLDKALEKVEVESSELEKLKEQILRRNDEKSVAPMTNSRRNKEVKTPIKKKVVSSSQPLRKVQPKQFITSNLASISSFNSSFPQSQESELQPIQLVKEELSSGAPIISLEEFSKFSTSDMKAKPIVGSKDSYIVDIEGQEVLVKAVEENGKRIGFKVVGSVTRNELVKSLIADRVELLDLKGEIYKYDDFMKLLNSSK